jgi:hypothetical protein
MFVATMGLIACEGGGDSSVKPGSVKLRLSFPVFTGAEAISGLSATLEKPDGTGRPVTLKKTVADFAVDTETGDNTTTLVFDPVPSGLYILIMTFYRGEAVAALCIEGVTVWPDVESNKWLGSEGESHDTRTFRPEEFRSMAVAASFILKNSDNSMVPLSMAEPMPTSWTLDKSLVTNDGKGMRLEISLYGGPGTSLSEVTVNGKDTLPVFITTNGSSPIPVYTGTFDIGTDAALISVTVQAPDRTTELNYTITEVPGV